MEYLNVTVAFTRSPEYIGSEPVDRATWLNLAAYCAMMENGGVIIGCREWKDRRCQQTLGITSREMLRAGDLWHFEGDDLHVHFYPAEQEAIVIRKRGLARHNGKLGGRPKKTNAGTDMGTDIGSQDDPPAKPKSVSTSVPISEPEPEPISESVKERKGKEGKEIERESVREADLSSQAEQIVNAYPRRERYADSLVIVRKHLAAGESFAVMLAGTRAAAAVLAAAPSGAANKYSPSALKFFEGKRWMDDPETLIRPPSANGSKGELTDEQVALQLGGRAGDYNY